jgi:hypothetical protein
MFIVSVMLMEFLVFSTEVVPFNCSTALMETFSKLFIPVNLIGIITL